MHYVIYAMEMIDHISWCGDSLGALEKDSTVPLYPLNFGW